VGQVWVVIVIGKEGTQGPGVWERGRREEGKECQIKREES